MRWAALLALLVAASAACGSAKTPSPTVLLSEAKQKVDASPALHFVLSSAGTSGTKTTITGGSGDIARPDAIRGTFTVSLAGIGVSVKIIAAHGKFYAEAPFQSHYEPTAPDKYGIGDPSKLLDPNEGLTSLLANLQNSHSDGRTRVNGQLVDKVTGTVPGTKIPDILPDSVPSQPVVVSALIVPSSHEVRQFVLTGPFTATKSSTYRITLTDYGEPVNIELPQ